MGYTIQLYTVFLAASTLLVNSFFVTKLSYRTPNPNRLFGNPLRESFFSPFRKYPLSRSYYERYIKRLNSKNSTLQNDEILGKLNMTDVENDSEGEDMIYSMMKAINDTESVTYSIILNKQMFEEFSNELMNNYNEDKKFEDDLEDLENGEYFDIYGNKLKSFGTQSGKKGNKKSENFEVISKSPYNFSSVGGYDKIKSELYQCIDILANHTKYEKYNVRTPRGLIFEGPPGNGKTLLAKSLAGEAGISFIPVSGSEFQDKYVGVGSGRIRELFKLAKENVPCIIFIDEIDALGRQRSKDGDSSGNERDATLNELLIGLDGFKDYSGVFVVGATNRIDLLDNALTRPGRIDKKVYIGNPDDDTRREILKIHLRGKPYDKTVVVDDLVDQTDGLSGAQIENLLNEAMLNALRYNKNKFSADDIEEVMKKIIGGWQPTEHKFTEEMIDQICVHELGHAVVGLLSKHHAKMRKIVINSFSPTTPAYTLFEHGNTVLSKREALFEHLAILLGGRVAEEVFYGISVTTGAINDFEEALKLAQKMICYYGMGKELIYPSYSDKYKEIIDTEVSELIHAAYGYAEFVIRHSRDLIIEGVEILKRDNVLRADQLNDLINRKYQNILNLEPYKV